MLKLSHEYFRLTMEPSPMEEVEVHNMMLETGFSLINSVHDEIPQRNEQVNDALIVFQMVIAKGLAVKSLAEGLKFHNSLNGKKMQHFLDPTSIAVLARTQFEAFATFHNIFNSTSDQDLTDILYDLWVIAGLKERQRTVGEEIAVEHKEKVEAENRNYQRKHFTKSDLFGARCRKSAMVKGTNKKTRFRAFV